MVASALLFVGGMRPFNGQSAGGRRLFALGILVYAGLLGPVCAVWGQQGRYALLNVVLGLLWSALAENAAHAARRTRERGLSTPLVVSSVLPATTLLWMVFVRLHGRVAELAIHDALTGVLNRNGLDEALTRHFETRAAPPLTLLQVYVDHFKRVNDRHGHACGDAVLREIGRLLPEPHAAGGVRCTISVGISRRFARREDCDAARREAGAALYAAKSAGRNRVMAFDAAAAA